MKKKIISLILSISMIISLLAVLPMPTLAETVASGSALTEAEKTASTITVKSGESDGTASHPLEIWNASQLSDFASKVNSGAKVASSDFYYTQAHVKLMADITFNEGYTYELESNYLVKVTDPSGLISYVGTGKCGTVATWYKDSAGKTTGVVTGFAKPESWTPISSIQAKAYLSTFDGNGHKIKGIFYAKNSTEAAGLFGYAGTNAYDKVEIKDLSLVDSCIIGAGSTGGIVGYLYNNINDPTTSSKKCNHLSGTCARGFTTSLDATSDQNQYEDILGFVISSCNNLNSVVTSKGNNVGGIVGEAGATYHYSTKAIYKNLIYTSSDENAIVGCTNSATVLGSSYVAGIVGKSNIGYNCNLVNNGKVYATGDYVAGIIGYGTANTFTSLKNEADITSAGSYVAGIVGLSYNTVSSSLNSGDIKGRSYVAGIMAILKQSGPNIGVQSVANIGQITSTGNNASGIIGVLGDSITEASVVNVYNTANVSAGTANSAASIIVGNVSPSDVCTVTVDKVYSVGGTLFIDPTRDTVTFSGSNVSNAITESQVSSGELALMLGATFGQSVEDFYPIPGSPDAVKWTIVGADLELASNIKVNLYLKLHSDIEETAKIHVTLNGKNNVYDISALDSINGYIVLTVEAAAKEMNDLITVEIYDNGEAVGFARTYSVNQYARRALSDDSGLSAEAKALVMSMLNYGGAAQRYFNHNIENIISNTVANVTLPDADLPVIVKGNVNYYGTTLLLESELTLRHYFLGEVSGESFYVNGEAVEAVFSSGYCYVDIPIAPNAVSNAYTVSVGTTTVSYSALNYLINMKDNHELSELVKAIYDYYLKAEAYVVSIG